MLEQRVRKAASQAGGKEAKEHRGVRNLGKALACLGTIRTLTSEKQTEAGGRAAKLLAPRMGHRS